MSIYKADVDIDLTSNSSSRNLRASKGGLEAPQNVGRGAKLMKASEVQ
jgi:hypothetical protein